MDTTIGIGIVIPCYNEGDRLPVERIRRFIPAHPDALLCFVDDGSTDGTAQLLEGLRTEHPDRVAVVTLDQNRGKAEAVRQGVLACAARYDPRHIAFLDADLAVSPEECYAMRQHLAGGVSFCFGSRIARVGSTIERKWRRHVVGRIIATFISGILDLRVYDTQCGCKLFTREIAAVLFDAPFLSRWLFDVELFSRFILLHGREGAMTRMTEVPLTEWIDRGRSKVEAGYAFRLWIDLFLIHREHQRGLARSVKA